MTKLRQARPDYTPALAALAALHEGHGAFFGGNFFDCSTCCFHAHNGSDGTAEEHDGSYSFRRTYAVEDGKLKMIDEHIAANSKPTPSYVELYDALEKIANGGPLRISGKPASDLYREIAKRALRRQL
jgi:hypothetical protein